MHVVAAAACGSTPTEAFMKKVLSFVKKNSFLICLIVLGCLIFYWVKDYKQVPSGIGPAFFPKVVATLLIALSVICMVTHRNTEQKGEFEVKDGASKKILIASVMFIFAVNIMKYIQAELGIFVFLFSYLCYFASVKWWKSVLVSILGTAVMYIMIVLLRISL